jgi:phosphoglycerol transferase
MSRKSTAEPTGRTAAVSPTEALAQPASRSRMHVAVAAALPYCATAVLALLCVVSMLHLWGTDLHVPISTPLGDYWFSALMVKSVLEFGTLWETPRIGYPGTGQLYDFPMSEGFHLLLIKAIGWVCSDPILSLNVYYLLGYVLASVCALALFQALGLPIVPSVGASLLYAFLPQHYLPGQAHPFLTAYYPVPLIVLVMIWLVTGEPLIRSFGLRPLHLSVTRKGWASLFIAVVMGATGVYYAFFATIFLSAIVAQKVLAVRKLSAAVPALLIAAVITGTLVINLLPSIVYHWQHGSNPHVAQRSPAEADMYALRLAQLVLPIHDHRIPPLANFKQWYVNTNPPSSDATVSLGTVGSAGFLLLIASAIFPTLGAWAQGLRPFIMLNLLGLLIGTEGGLGSLFAYTVSPSIRCYYRICVYLAIFSFAAVLIVLKQAVESVSSRRAQSVLYSFAGILLSVALLDLTPRFPNKRATIEASWRGDRHFVQQIEGALPRGAAVFQLPYEPFPEHGFTHRMFGYDHLRGYLFSNHLRWSYGSMRGRDSDRWQKEVAGSPTPVMVKLLRDRQFSGIYIDTHGYSDGGRQIISELQQLSASPVISNKRFLFFPLQTFAPSPVYIRWADGSKLHPIQRELLTSDALDKWQHLRTEAGKNGEIALANIVPASYVLMQHAIPLRANQTYEVVIHARSDDPSAELFVDLYAGASYDAPEQEHVVRGFSHQFKTFMLTIPSGVRAPPSAFIRIIRVGRTPVYVQSVRIARLYE